MMQVQDRSLITVQMGTLMMVKGLREVGAVRVTRSLLYQLRRLGAVALKEEVRLQVMIFL